MQERRDTIVIDWKSVEKFPNLKGSSGRKYSASLIENGRLYLTKEPAEIFKSRGIEKFNLAYMGNIILIRPNESEGDRICSYPRQGGCYLGIGDSVGGKFPDYGDYKYVFTMSEFTDGDIGYRPGHVSGYMFESIGKTPRTKRSKRSVVT